MKHFLRMIPMALALSTGWLCLALSGCQSSGVSEHISYKGWTDAYRMSNGEVELVVVPSAGRIMHYGPVGGPNILWENPVITPADETGQRWKNVGGDTVWIWPQSDWPRFIGHIFPPPDDLEHGYELRIVNPLEWELRSPVVKEFGLRVVRRIQMEPHGTKVTISNRLVREAAPSTQAIAATTNSATTQPTPAGPLPVAAWQISQLAVPDVLVARLVEDSGLAGLYRPLIGAWKSVALVGPGLVQIEHPDDHSAKIGLDADTFAATIGNWIFIQRDKTSHGVRYPGERAQVYFKSGPKFGETGDSGRYLETEFTGLKKSLGEGEPASLIVQWELQPLPKEGCSAFELARKIR